MNRTPRSASRNKNTEPDASQAVPDSKHVANKTPQRGGNEASGLILVATPIGNLGDMTRRGIEALEQADLILCEDTRVSGKLLRAFSIQTELMAYHDHNAERMRPRVMRRLSEGARVALISDAGTPLISDPGYRLVQACHEARIPVTTTPGASAPIVALSLSGLPSDRFLFAGFLPTKKVARRATYEELRVVPASLIFFESPKRLAVSLADATEALGDRPAAVARELTKLHEEVRRGTLSELTAHYTEAGPPRGEIVLVIAPPDAEAAIDDEGVDGMLRQAMQHASLRDAVDEVARIAGRPKREIYARALALSETD